MGNSIETSNMENQKRSISSYGWRPQLPDRRDLKFTPGSTQLPPHFDLRDHYHFGPILNQGNLGSCTANSIAEAFQFNEIKQGYGQAEFDPSRLFIYYNERKMEGSIGTDAGAALRDGFKSINSTGICSEELWPYNIDRFADEPPRECYDQARTEKVLKYRKVSQTVDAMRHALFDEHQPICFGFTVYDSFESAEVKESGIMPMPAAGEKVQGGHAVLCVGFDDESKRFIVRNSWGEDWGQAGYFTMPYEFISDPDSASDFWIIETIDRAPAKPGDLEYSSAFPVLGAEACEVRAHVLADEPEAECSDPAVKFRTLATSYMNQKAETPAIEAAEEQVTEAEVEPVLEAAQLTLTGDWTVVDAQLCRAGSECLVTWSSEGDVKQVDLMYCCSSWGSFLSSWSPIAQGIANEGSYCWSVPADVGPNTRYWIRVAATDSPSVYSESAYFIVKDAESVE